MIVVHHLNNSRSQRILWLLEELGLDGAYPKLTGFLECIHARPAYRRALERGGKYDYA